MKTIRNKGIRIKKREALIRRVKEEDPKLAVLFFSKGDK
jgi:hypothetical protein